jgi:predicted nucleic acid-binding protein
MVIDASVMVDALVGAGALADEARRRIKEAFSLEAPHLVDVEVAHALGRLEASGRIRPALASTAVDQLRKMPISRYPHVDFLDRIWELKDSVTPYDAAYVAVAEAADTPLLTLDARLASAPGLRCEVELIS